MHRFLVSAAHKSSGKTTLCIGMAAALRALNRDGKALSVQPFKKGPDYIDPLWLGLAAGRSCFNLDFFLSPNDEIRDQFARYGHDADVCLVEGNKGLYDGLDLKGSNSNAALAKLLDLPVILVLDARGMTRGIAPLILGYQAFDSDIRIAGVILNRLGGQRHESKLRAVIEYYTDVAVIGAVQEDPRLALVERHLGLMPANEATAAERHVADIAEIVARQVDLDRLLAVSVTDTALPSLLLTPAPQHIVPRPPAPNSLPAAASPPVRIAIARDAAFGFYYADDLAALVAAGAQLLAFDTLHDSHLPECDGIFIGGGFPESFIAQLEANSTLRNEILAAIDAGMPAYAECGGLMYLSRSIAWKGKRHHMVGVITGDVVMNAKPVGRGYVIIEPTRDHPWPNTNKTKSDNDNVSSSTAPTALHAHEFHYSSIENLPADTRYAYKVNRGHGVDGKHDGIIYKNLLASYTHLRATAGCDWPAQFVQHVRNCQNQ